MRSLRFIGYFFIMEIWFGFWTLMIAAPALEIDYRTAVFMMGIGQFSGFLIWLLLEEWKSYNF